MSSEEAQPVRTLDEGEFEGIATQGTVYVKWDVKGGSDRTHNPYLDTCSQLEGSPNIQGVEIRSAVNVRLYCYGGSSCSGSPSITIDGPTSGKNKIDPRRLASYKVIGTRPGLQHFEQKWINKYTRSFSDVLGGMMPSIAQPTANTRTATIQGPFQGIDHVPHGNGIMVFNVFGVKMIPLHLIAYDEFMFRQLQTDKSKRQLCRTGFLSFWNDLKSGKVKITNELKKPQYPQLNSLEFWEDSKAREINTMNHAELDFSEKSCPYDCPADATVILTEDESQVFLYVRKLFRDPGFVRANQRDWLEILHNADVVVQDRELGPAYWDNELNKFCTNYIAYLENNESI